MRALLAGTLLLHGASPGLWGQSASPPAPGDVAALDHVVVAVSDLDAASATFRGLGFRLEEGRLHANGLENRFVELGDGTELELMAVRRPPADDTAEGYARFLREGGEGGAFLALRGRQETVLAAARAAGIAATPVVAGPFRYVTFPAPELGALFVIEYAGVEPGGAPPEGHPNQATGTAAVWVEGGDVLEALLGALGGEPRGPRSGPDGRAGAAYALGGGTVVVLPTERARPRVVRVDLRVPTPPGRTWPPAQTHGVWLTLTPR